MLDLSETRGRKRWRLPKGVKGLFLALALIPLCYGAIILLDFMSFYKNSVETQAIVVNMEPARLEMPARIAEGIKGGDYGPNEIFFVPGFFYTHENGQYYIGGALTDSSKWSYKPGDMVDIRYRREMPEMAQPVTLMKFWATPVGFIAGGAIMFVALSFAFVWAEIKRAREKPLNLRRTQRLNLARR